MFRAKKPDGKSVFQGGKRSGSSAFWRRYDILYRQDNLEFRTHACLTAHLDRPMVRLHNAFDQGKAQAGALFTPQSAFRDMLKGLEDSHLIVGFDADARVLDLELKAVFHTFGKNRDFSAGGRKFQSIGN